MVGVDLTFAMHPMTQNGEPREKLWQQARDIATQALPLLLHAIETEARAVIHVNE